MHTPARRDLVTTLALALLLTVAGFSVWMNVTTFGHMITIVFAEAAGRILVAHSSQYGHPEARASRRRR